ncbi:hypothetical protein BKA62DRAFT_691154 [Auriculariales sp. MPI-PUGE-AT-0066]|nr:hypothetical protein BKA62DRAFT_691154 [Auriculariales sp. MPI-PUGE-AT-0066]
MLFSSLLEDVDPVALEGEIILRYKSFSDYAGLTLLWYDYLLTFSAEWKRIWSCEKGWFVVFWCLIRYPPLLMRAATLPGDFIHQWTLSACHQFFAYSWLSATLTISIVHLSFLLRLYALYSRKVRVLVLPLALWLGRIAIILVITVDGVRDRSAVLPSGYCLAKLNLRLVMVSASLALAFDFTVLITGMVRCYTLWQQSMDRALLSVLLRDGAGYFGIVTGANALNILVVEGRMNREVFPIILMITTTLPAIIVCRMILGLRAEATTSRPDHTSTGFSNYNDLSVPSNTFLGSVVDKLFDIQTAAGRSASP